MQDRIDAVRKQLETEMGEVAHEIEVELPIRIDEARQKGDLSENAEYESAKERQAYLAVYLLQLKKRHAKLAKIDLNDIDKNTVGLYSVVEIEEVDNGKSYTYELVLPDEMNIKKGMISIMSPIGQQLRGGNSGDTITIKTPARTFDVKIIGFTNILGEKFDS